MASIRSFFSTKPQENDEEVEYQNIDTDHEYGSDEEEDHVRRPVYIVEDERVKADGEPFTWFEYSIFCLLGIAMLWAWNMFLAAAPYFQVRFHDNKTLLNNFQAAITSVGCVTNLLSTFLFSRFQAGANYPRRILSALFINLVVFTLLATSAKGFHGVSSTGYFAFILIMVFSTSTATGLISNGAFAFASSFGRPEYIQALMTGQAIAGVLPSVAQILAVLAVPDHPASDSKDEIYTYDSSVSTSSAFVYFLAAVAVSVITLVAVMPLIRKHNRLEESSMLSSLTSFQELEAAKRKTVGMLTLYKKLRWLAASIFLCFAVTMFFPVFTQKVTSVVPADGASRLYQPAAYIPLGFLVWNLGDLGGRLLTLGPLGKLHVPPKLLLVFAILRSGFIPLYFLCNINGHAKIKSDVFYLFVVQMGFGATNGWVGSLCMMEASGYVDEDEREASGGFMATNLVAGLTVGSLASFSVAGVS